MIRFGRLCLLGVFALLTVLPSLSAYDEPDVEDLAKIDLRQELQARLQRRLQRTPPDPKLPSDQAQLALLQNLIKQLQDNPQLLDQLANNPRIQQQIQDRLRDPRTLQLLQQLRNDQPQNTNIDRLQNLAQQLQQRPLGQPDDWPQPLPKDPKPTPPPPTVSPPPASSVQSQPSVDPQQRSRQIAQRLQKLLGPLGESQAVRDLLTDLTSGKLGQHLGADGNEFLRSLAEHEDDAKALIEAVERNFGPISEWRWPSANDLKLPSLGWGGSSSLGSWNAAAGGNPSPMPPSGESSINTLWLLFGLVGLGIVGWLIWTYQPPPQSSDSGAKQLGPWAIRPEDLSTTAQLIQAFEYVALLKCGFDAQTWNHRMIAEQLAQVTPLSADAAYRFADLYEVARYAPPSTTLTPDQFQLARGYLRRLAEVS